MLSCRPNRLNELHATYLMPGVEMNESPAEEMEAHHGKHPPFKMAKTIRTSRNTP